MCDITITLTVNIWQTNLFIKAKDIQNINKFNSFRARTSNVLTGDPHPALVLTAGDVCC